MWHSPSFNFSLKKAKSSISQSKFYTITFIFSLCLSDSKKLKNVTKLIFLTSYIFTVLYFFYFIFQGKKSYEEVKKFVILAKYRGTRRRWHHCLFSAGQLFQKVSFKIYLALFYIICSLFCPS